MKNGLKTVTVRIPRFGGRMRSGDDHNQLGDVSRLQAVLERSSGTSFQCDLVAAPQCRAWCALRRDFRATKTRVARLWVRPAARLHVEAAAAAMDRPCNCRRSKNGDRSSTCPQRLQFECAAAELIGYHTVDPDEVQRCAHLLFHWH